MLCISTIIKKFNKSNITTVVPVVLLLVGIAFNLLLSQYFIGADVLVTSQVFGGPKALALAGGANYEQTFIAGYYGIEDFAVAEDVVYDVSDLITNDATLAGANRPLSNVVPTRDGLLLYKIQSGDTLSKIAANFEISLNTIMWANPQLRGHVITPGQEITLLPVSGVLHKISENETLDSVAAVYGVSKEVIMRVNKNIQIDFAGGGTIIIPGAKPKKNLAVYQNLPVLSGYFVLPTTGWNWGELHSYNAVDIANACGTQIYAAAEGLVARLGSLTGWNNGYGGFVEIEHPNKTVTRYAHLNKILVAVGDYVNQKELIGEMGNSGNVKGEPGCHLHFEVEGAKNPLAK